MTYDITVQQIAPQHAAVIAATLTRDDIAAFMARVFSDVMTAMRAQGVHPVGMPFGRYAMTESGFITEAGFPTDRPIETAGEVHAIELPGGTVATTMHTGSYDGVGGAYEALQTWLAEHGYEPTGAPWESYLDGPEVAEPRTVITWPYRRA